MNKNSMKIYLGTDHAGFETKEKVKNILSTSGYDVEDLGALSFDKDDDYPDYVSKVGDAVSKDAGSFGFVFGKSGQGEAMVSNRYSGVRAGVFYGGNIEIVKLLRKHNNANVLSIGGGFVEDSYLEEIIKTFLETPFSGEERHARRISKF